MKRSLLLLALFVGTAFAGCQSLPEPVCESTLLVPARAVSGPRTIAFGQTAAYTLTYNTGTSCGQFDRLVFSTVTLDSVSATNPGRTTRQVGVQARYVGCTCTADTVTTAQTTYQFKPWRAGKFVLKFLTRKNQFVTDTLTVR